MIRRSPAILALAMVPSLALAVAVWQPSRPVPPFEAFWVAPPKPDPATLFLWPFDEQAERTKEPDREIEDLLKTGGVADEDASVRGAEPVAYRLKGDAAVCPDGRFGGGLRLSAKGCAEGPVDVGAVVRTEGACTIDFWVHPDPGGGDSVLAAVPGTDGRDAVQVVRSADGAVRLETGRTVLIRHSRTVPPGQWTHLALVLFLSDPAQLLVNGTLELSPAGDKSAVTALAGRLGTLVRFGSGEGLAQGFSGRMDSARLSRRERLFYELADDSAFDPKAERRLLKGPPWFSGGGTLPVACSFDGTLTPEEFAGVAVEGKADASDFRPGVRGRALNLTRIETMAFALAGYSTLPLEQGSLEFWFRPVDWNNFFHGNFHGTDVPWLTLLRFASKGCPPYRGLRVLRIAQGQTHKDYAGGAPWVRFHPGRWTHVVCVWGDGGGQVYLDGELQPIHQVGFWGPVSAADQEQQNRWLKESAGKDDGTYRLTLTPSHTLVDELRVYPHPLSADEVRNAYGRFFADAARRVAELPPIRVEWRCDYYGKELTALFSCLPVDGTDPAFMDLKLTAPDGRTVVWTTNNVALGEGFRGSASTAFEPEFGRFGVEAGSKSRDGRTLKSLKAEYVRAQPAWWHNDLGRDGRVPRPWTPIRLQGTKLEVWGRTFEIEKGGLPRSIVSVGAETMSAPAQMHGRVNGSEVKLAGVETKMGSAKDDMVEWSGRLAGGALAARVRGTLEYDGLAHFVVSLEPADGEVEVESFVVDFPLRREPAQQLIANGGHRNMRGAYDVRMVPEGTGRVWDSKTSKPGMLKGVRVGHFCPVIWIGDDDRGLCFFGENDRGWTPDNDSPSQEIRRAGDAVIYRMNIITRPIKLATPREFDFYVHPTPTKSLEPGWRAHNRGGKTVPVGNYEVIDNFVGDSLAAPPEAAGSDIAFKVEPGSWAGAAWHAAAMRERFGAANPVLKYMDASWPAFGSRMADFTPRLWGGSGRLAWTREVEDYFTYWVNEYFKRGVLDGVYIDDVALEWTWWLHSAAYRLDDGEIQPGYSTLGFRRFLQRTWTVFDQAGKRARIVPHMTWCFEIPALSFCDAAVNGEDRDIVFPAEWRYMDVWTRDELRIMGGSEKWGFLALWKSGINAQNAPLRAPKTVHWLYWQNRTMNAHLFQHDLIPMWGDPNDPFKADLRAFGLSDPEMRFVPDWKLNGAAVAAVSNSADSAASKNIMLAFLVRSGRALMMVSNYAKTDTEVRVTVDPARLFGAEGAKILTFRDADSNLKEPKSDAASAAEITKQRNKMGDDLLGLADKPSDEQVRDELEGRSPEAKEKERLALRSRENTVTMVVRKQDFRLVEVRPATE